MSVETRRAERKPKTETEKALQAKKAEEGLKNIGYMGLSSAPISGEIIAAKELPDDLKQIKDLFEQGYRERDFKKLGLGALYTTAVTAGLIPVLGPVGRAGKNILKKGVDEAESLFKTQTDLLTKGPTGGGGGAALETAGVGQLDQTKKILKDETKPITTDIPNNAPAGELVNAPKINPTMAGLTTETGKKQAKIFQELEEQGNLTPEKMFEQTGVYRGGDRKLRYEIDDRNANLVKMPKSGETYSLYQILEFPDLYKEYFKDIKVPGKTLSSLRNIQVEFVRQPKSSYRGKYYPSADSIEINLSKFEEPAIGRNLAEGTLGKKEDITSVLLHEVQHAVQRRERFSTGTSIIAQLEDSPNYKEYLKALDRIDKFDKVNKNLVADQILTNLKKDSSYASYSVDEMVGKFFPVFDKNYKDDKVLAFLKNDTTLSNKEIQKTKNLIDKRRLQIKQDKDFVIKEDKIAQEKYYNKYGEREAKLVQQRYKRRLQLKAFNLDDDVVKGDMRLETGFIKGEDSNLGQMGGFNKGGDIMKKQMELFDEGGLKDEGNTVDPVSGNDVPPGATQEEVRDDIPAQLSEGEFVFPADVVRYLGLEFLMKLRQKAKAGLKRMEDMGQMGNADEATIPDDAPFNPSQDDLPFTMEDLDMEDEKEYNEGGVVKAQTGTYVAPGAGTNVMQPQNSYPTPIEPRRTLYMPPQINPEAAPVGGFMPRFTAQTGQGGQQTSAPTFQTLLGATPGQYDEFREYVNEAGMVLNIPFKNGEPIYPIPEGYTFVDPEATKTEEVTTKEVTPQTTRVVEDTSSGDDDEEPKGAVDLTGATLSYKSMFNMDKLDKELKDIASNQINLFSPYGVAERGITGKIDLNNAILQAQTVVMTKFKIDERGNTNFNLVDLDDDSRNRLANQLNLEKAKFENLFTDTEGSTLSLKDVINSFNKISDRKLSMDDFTVVTKTGQKTNIISKKKVNDFLNTIVNPKRPEEIKVTNDFKTQRQIERNEEIFKKQEQEIQDSGDGGYEDTGQSVMSDFGSAEEQADPDFEPVAKGGLLKKKQKVKKMKRGGLASRK